MSAANVRCLTAKRDHTAHTLDLSRYVALSGLLLSSRIRSKPRASSIWAAAL